MDFHEISGYEVIRQLGSGGMGQVFLVQHPRLPRRDAMKLLDAGVSRNDEFQTRFRREADLLALLSHPNIVTLFDRGEFEGRLWITMEFVDGTDAAAMVKSRGPLPLPLALALIEGAGTALDHAWRKQRITHRDVKPANILVALSESGTPDAVKLADFGIAKAAGESTSLTSTGITIGTVSYLSPEAIEGLDLDTRADIYSLGCTAFELLAGAPPFAGNSITALMTAHLTRPVPDVTDRVPGLPRALNAVFEKALAKKPDGRYQSCADFVAAVRAAGTGGRTGPEAAAAATTQAAPTMPASKGKKPPSVKRPGSTDGPGLSRRARTLLITAAVIATVFVLAIVGLALRGQSNSGHETPNTAASMPPLQVAPSPPAPAPSTPPEPTWAVTPPPASKAGFYGEWGNHFMSVTLAPDGTAIYKVWLGVANGATWSATWSPMTSTAAMVVLTKQEELHEATREADLVVSRYPGQAFTFTLETDGYATITDPSGKPVSLCPRGTGFHDTQGLCGA